MATESRPTLEAAIEAWNRRHVEATLENIREDVVRRTAQQIYRFDEAHQLRELHAFTEDEREEALREAGIDG